MKKMIIPIILIMLYTGCWDQRIFEQTGFILQAGIEKSKKGELLITYTHPVIGAKGGEERLDVISSEATLLREARENIRRKSALNIVGGKVQQFLFSEEIAREGIHKYFEIFQRDASNSLLAWVLVVEGSPYQLIDKSSNFENKPRLTNYLNQLLKNSWEDSYIPVTRVYRYDISYFAPGIDPITPLVRLGPNEVIMLGTVLFSKDKMVGKIGYHETSLLLAMKGVLKNTQYIVKAPKDKSEQGSEAKDKIAIRIINRKRDMKIELLDNKPVINISLKLKGFLSEYRWDNLKSNEVQKELEKYLEEKMQKECIEILNYLRNIKSDPIGIENEFRAKYYDYWKRVDWQEEYEKAKFNISIDLEIERYGVIE